MLLARRAPLRLVQARRAHITAGACSSRSALAASCGARIAHPSPRTLTSTSAARPPPRSLATVHCAARASATRSRVAHPPARAFATLDEDRPKKEPTRWENLKTLWREHGLAFGALYVGANVATFVPIFGALTVGGVDGPELILWAVDRFEITYDLSWLETINKDLVNAFIALEMNAWGDVVRLPIVVAYTPRFSRWLKMRRGLAEAPVTAPAPARDEAPAKKKRRKRGG